MATQTDHAVVLRLTDYSETSQIATFFTRDNGRLRLIAKGSRRGTKKRFAAGLDLLELGAVQFIPPRGESDLGTLTDWSQLELFIGLRRSAVALHGGLYAAEATAALSADLDPHPDLFEALSGLLKGLASPSPTQRPLRQIVGFQRRLLTEIGYGPQLDHCVDCGRPPAPRSSAWFSSTAGGLICRDCEMHHAEKRSMPAVLRREPDADAALLEWFRLLDYHERCIVGQPLRTSEPLERLLAAGR